MTPYFLTSSPVDQDWPWVQRLHADIQRELRFQVGDDVGGVIDVGRAGDTESVARIPALVAIVSDHYFMDVRCGTHWSIFSARIFLDEARRPGAVDHCLIPVLWRPLRRRPPTGISLPAAWIVEHQGDPTPVGLRELMRTRRHGSNDAYLTAVRSIARQVIAAQASGLASWPDVAVSHIAPRFGEDEVAVPPDLVRGVPSGGRG